MWYHTHMRTRAHEHTLTHTHTYIHTHTQARTYARIHTQYRHTHACAHKTHTHTHTHTHTRARARAHQDYHTAVSSDENKCNQNKYLNTTLRTGKICAGFFFFLFSKCEWLTNQYSTWTFNHLQNSLWLHKILQEKGATLLPNSARQDSSSPENWPADFRFQEE